MDLFASLRYGDVRRLALLRVEQAILSRTSENIESSDKGLASSRIGLALHSRCSMPVPRAAAGKYARNAV